MLRRPIAERDAGTAKLADKRFLACYFFDDGRLAKPDFPQALANLGLAREFTYASGSTNRQLGQAHALGAKGFSRAVHEEDGLFN
jgi:hypothetical protein